MAIKKGLKKMCDDKCKKNLLVNDITVQKLIAISRQKNDLQNLQDNILSALILEKNLDENYVLDLENKTFKKK